MARKRSFPRRQYRAAFRAWCRVNGRTLTIVLGGFAVLLLLETAFVMVLPASHERAYLLGVLHAGLVVGAGWAVHLMFLATRRDAIHQLRGAWGEDNTTQVLRAARRRRRVWAWVDGVAVDGGDIDHLVATRRGGLLAVDSKWRSEIEDPAPLVRSAQRAANRARGLVGSVTSRTRGRRRARTGDLAVRPVIVVWGPAQEVVAGHPVVDGVIFVPGRDLGPWLASLDDIAMERGLARDLIAKVRSYDRGREKLVGARTARPAPSRG